MSQQQKYTIWRFLFLSIIIAGFLAVTSCSKTPDVRLTLCQDLTVLFLNPPDDIVWQKHEPVIRGYNDLQMPVSYVRENDTGKVLAKASCFYAYVENEDAIGAAEFNTPTEAYSTYPDKMILNGKTVKKSVLENAINEVMLRQAGKAIVKAKEKIKEGVKMINQKAEKSIQ